MDFDNYLTPIKTTGMYEKEYVSVLYNLKCGAVEVNWKGFATDSEYKEALMAANKIITQRRCTKWLSDMTYGKAVSNDTNKWVQTEFIPRAIKQGIKKAAFIVSKDIFRKMYANSIKGVIEASGATLKYFDNRDEAEIWLRQ